MSKQKHRNLPKAKVDRHHKDLENMPKTWMPYQEAMMWKKIKDNPWRKLTDDNTEETEDQQIYKSREEETGDNGGNQAGH